MSGRLGNWTDMKQFETSGASERIVRTWSQAMVVVLILYGGSLISAELSLTAPESTQEAATKRAASALMADLRAIAQQAVALGFPDATGAHLVRGSLTVNWTSDQEDQ